MVSKCSQEATTSKWYSYFYDEESEIIDRNQVEFKFKIKICIIAITLVGLRCLSWNAEGNTTSRNGKFFIINPILYNLHGITEAASNNVSHRFTNSKGGINRKLSKTTIQSDLFSKQSTIKKQQDDDESTIIFYAIGDQPYGINQGIKMKQQLSSLPSDGKFLIHVGDIRRRRGKRSSANIVCTQSEFTSVSSILQTSTLPVFIIRTYFLKSHHLQKEN
jgi:hypothetical protein